jgi:hypothetical protein
MVDIQVLYMFLGGFTIFAFLIGAAAGWWLGGRSGSRRREKPVEKPPVAEPQSDKKIEVLRFVRERDNGALLMEMRGKIYRQAQELTDVERKNLARFGYDWLKWLGAPAAPQQPEAAANEGGAVAQSKPDDTTLIESAEPQQVKPGQTTVQQVKTRPSAPAAPVEDAVRPTSIVAQIDEILQEILPLSPLANKQIKLTEDPDQGVVVWVDNQCYSGVDGVPDPDVRALLRKAAQEWENRSG